MLLSAVKDGNLDRTDFVFFCKNRCGHCFRLLWYNISVAAGRYHDRIYGYAYFCYNKAVMD